MLTACEQYAPLSPVSRWRRASPPHSCAPREWCRRRTPRSARSRRRRDCSSPERLCQAICWVVVLLWRIGPADQHREPGRLPFSTSCAHTEMHTHRACGMRKPAHAVTGATRAPARGRRARRPGARRCASVARGAARARPPRAAGPGAGGGRGARAAARARAHTPPHKARAPRGAPRTFMCRAYTVLCKKTSRLSADHTGHPASQLTPHDRTHNKDTR